MNKLFHILKN